MAPLYEMLSEIKTMLAEGRLAEVGARLAGTHPADIARFIEELGEDDKILLFKALDARLAAEVVVELDDDSRELVIGSISTNQLSAIVDDLPSDEATDIIADLPVDQAREVLSRIDLEDSAEVRTLLQYAEDTAGGLMQLELVSARTHQTVAEVVEAIRAKKDEVGDLHYVYVVDRMNMVKGWLPLAKLLLAEQDTLVGRIMEPCQLIVEADEDQEEVAHKFRRYDVVSAPVVDAQGRLLGRITIDDVMEVMEDETREDMLRMAGTSSKEEMFYPGNVLKTSRLRLPWLLTNLLGGLVTGSLLWKFRVTLADALFLITFVPVITAMGGNVGLQSSTTMVRGFAVGSVTYKNLSRVLYKELRVALVMGVTCGGVVALVADIWHGNPWLGLVVFLAMAASFCAAVLMGTLAPAAFKRMGVDPAISSGPFVTTANDIVGILIYFSVATMFYHMLVP